MVFTTSSFNTHIWFVQETNGLWEMTVDYHKLKWWYQLQLLFQMCVFFAGTNQHIPCHLVYSYWCSEHFLSLDLIAKTVWNSWFSAGRTSNTLYWSVSGLYYLSSWSTETDHHWILQAIITLAHYIIAGYGIYLGYFGKIQACQRIGNRFHQKIMDLPTPVKS